MAYTFPVEPGHVLLFARSVGEDDPVFEQQIHADYGAELVAPTTFARASSHFDPDYELRPGAAGSQSVTSSRGTLHAEQHFEYLAPLRAGERLLVEAVPGRKWSKTGRTGRLDFTETILEYRDPRGELAIRARKVSVRTGDDQATGDDDE